MSTTFVVNAHMGWSLGVATPVREEAGWNYRLKKEKRREETRRNLLTIKTNGRHEETRTPDLYRVKKGGSNLNAFIYLAFPC